MNHQALWFLGDNTMFNNGLNHTSGLCLKLVSTLPRMYNTPVTNMIFKRILRICLSELPPLKEVESLKKLSVG